MKILIDGVIFSSQKYGGISRMWYEIASRLPGHGFDVRLIYPLFNNNLFFEKLLKQKNGIHFQPDVFYWPARIFQKSVVRRTTINLFYLAKDIELFHSTYFTTLPHRRIPSVVSVYDMVYELFEEQMGTKWSSFIVQKKKNALENAQIVVCISENTKNDLLQIYPWINPDHVYVIYNGISLYPPNQKIIFQEVAEKYKFLPRPFEYLLYVGNRGGYKNFKIISEWIKQCQIGKDILILCVGGEKEGTFEFDYPAQTVQPVFTGPLDEAELSVLYRHSLALIYPSLYEGFGFPVLEAMAHHCPVICSNTSSLPEVGGEASIYFDPRSIRSLDDAMQQLMKSPRGNLVQAGLLNISRFSWEKSVKQLVDVYARYL